MEDTALSLESFQLMSNTCGEDLVVGPLVPTHEAPLMDEINVTHSKGNGDFHQAKKSASRQHAPEPIEISKFCADDMFTQFHRRVAILSWKDLQERFSRIPLSKIPSIAEDVCKFLDMLKDINKIDTSVPKRRLEGLLQKIKKVNEEEAKLHACMSAGIQAQELERLKEELKASMTLEDEAFNNYSSIEGKLAEVEEELAKLIALKKDLESSLEMTKKDVQDRQDHSSKLQEHISQVKNTPIYSSAEESRLQKLRDLLEVDFDELKNLS